MDNLEEVVRLCLHHMSHNEPKIRSAYLDLLARLPLSSVSHAMCCFNTNEENEFSANKVCFRKKIYLDF